jgi:hypothetical protein
MCHNLAPLAALDVLKDLTSAAALVLFDLASPPWCLTFISGATASILSDLAPLAIWWAAENLDMFTGSVSNQETLRPWSTC